MTDEQKTGSEPWREVGEQFQALGESLAAAFRTTWESEETRQQFQEVQSGLETMVSEIGQAIQDASTGPEAEKVRGEAKQAVESARVAGEQAWSEAQPHLLSALRQLNAEIQKVIARMERPEPGPEDSASATDSEEV